MVSKAKPLSKSIISCYLIKSNIFLTDNLYFLHFCYSILTGCEKMSKSKRISFENIDKYVEVGFNISFYRKRKGLTQDQLAEKSGISRSHLSAIEAAGIVRPFSLEVLFDIANALEIEPYKLLKTIEA